MNSYLSSTGLYLISKNQNMVPSLDKVLEDMVSFCMKVNADPAATVECLGRMACEMMDTLSSNCEKYLDTSEDHEYCFMDCA